MLKIQIFKRGNWCGYILWFIAAKLPGYECPVLWQGMLHGWGLQHATQKYGLQGSPHCQACISTAEDKKEECSIMPLSNQVGEINQHKPDISSSMKSIDVYDGTNF